MTKTVAVLMGGWSSEREVSLDTGQGVIKALKDLGYRVKAVNMTRNLSQLIQDLTPSPDVVFNALHGYGGEDGVIQGVLETLAIPYTHSGVLSSALGMDKVISRQIFSQAGILVPPYKVMRKETFVSQLPMPVPFVVKPRSDGSSRRVQIIQNQEAYDNLCAQWDYGKEDVIVEAYLDGREIQVAVMGEQAIGAIEIRPRRGFYDYQAKYTDGHADHLMPAPLDTDVYEKVLGITLKAHQLLGCRGVTRSDFIYMNGNGQQDFYLLELNTQPGLTPLSLVPEIVAHKGISFSQLVEWMVQQAQCDQPA